MPTTVPTTELAESLIELIMLSAVLTDEQKEAYMNDLVEGRMPKDLADHWDEFLSREQNGIDAEIQELDGMISLESDETERIARENVPALASIVMTHEKETQEICYGFMGKCGEIERTLNQDAENIVRTNKDDTEAEAIRAMLKQE